ncbi:MAG TPA: hypothetical protein VEB66_00055 [Opitutaceae bacterium]|nr:hypothetical protein [Opitutaceae bacterium]
MDESLQELENELKALRPRRPSTLLRARIERDLEAPAPAASRYTSATTLRSWKWTRWPAMAAAAGMLAALSIGLWQSVRFAGDPQANVAVQPPAAPRGAPAPGDAPAPREVYVPVAAASVLYDLRDEGAVTAPARPRRARPATATSTPTPGRTPPRTPR